MKDWCRVNYESKIDKFLANMCDQNNYKTGCLSLLINGFGLSPTVISVTDKGVLVVFDGRMLGVGFGDNAFFIYTSDKYVDMQRLDIDDTDLFEYVGTYSYTAASGSYKTVRAFKKSNVKAPIGNTYCDKLNDKE
jgi:hypothetical protein